MAGGVIAIVAARRVVGSGASCRRQMFVVAHAEDKQATQVVGIMARPVRA